MKADAAGPAASVPLQRRHAPFHYPSRATTRDRSVALAPEGLVGCQVMGVHAVVAAAGEGQEGPVPKARAELRALRGIG